MKIWINLHLFSDRDECYGSVKHENYIFCYWLLLNRYIQGPWCMYVVWYSSIPLWSAFYIAEQLLDIEFELIVRLWTLFPAIQLHASLIARSVFLFPNYYQSVLSMLYFTCFISVDGNYSEWSEFMQCSVTCGKGVQTRSRSCINPPPQHGGKNCSAFGPPVETKECNLKECPSKNLCFQFVIYLML